MFNIADRSLPPEAALPAMALHSLLENTGVREFVICAGARNSALLVMLAAVPGLRLWHHFEERSAAFFALGRILDHEHPVAVVTTSGTAVAELLPAMIEAHYQGLPLIALTADRPASYRGTGAPQAIEQAGIFGCYPTLALDVIDLDHAPETLAPLINWDPSGPLHLNLCLDEPHAASLPALRLAGAALRFKEQAGHHPALLPPNPGPPLPADTLNEWDRQNAPAPFTTEYPQPLLLAGDLLTSEIPSATAYALAWQAPLYAEAASGLRECAALRHLLVSGGDQALARVPHRSVIRLGGVPACRFWRDLENRPEIPVLSYSRSGHPGLARACQVVPLKILGDHSAHGKKGASEETAAAPPPAFPPLPALPSSPSNTAPPSPGHITPLLQIHPASEPALIHALSARIPPRAVLFTGNSLAIREWNLCARQAHPIHARALRGANGIDGNLSAFLGLAAEAQEAWCLVGDLTALYDLAAPWMLAQLSTPRLRIVVIQNSGGKIFSRLPSLQGLTSFERQIMENPHHISLVGWAQQWGLAHLPVAHPLPALTELPDRVVIELFPDPTATEAFWKALHLSQ